MIEMEKGKFGEPAVIRWFFYFTLILALVVVGDLVAYGVSRGFALLGKTGTALLSVSVLFLLSGLFFRRFAKKASLSIVMVLICLACIEAFIFIRSPWGRNFGWYVWPPRMSIAISPAGHLPNVAKEGRFSINSLGIRGPEFSRKDAYRILCIGGSTTECLYLDDDNAWPAQLAKNLSEYEPNIWVGNVGKSGLMAREHALLIDNLPEASQVDCYLVLCGINDIMNHLKGIYEERIADSWNRTFAIKSEDALSGMQRPLYRSLGLYKKLAVKQKPLKVVGPAVVQDVNAKWMVAERKNRWNAEKVDTMPDLSMWLDEYAASLREVVKASRKKGKRLVMMTQPIMHSEDMSTSLSALCWYGKRKDGKYYTSRVISKAMDAYNRKMIEVCKAEKVDCIDLASVLPKSDAVFYDDCHLNDSGARLMAKKVGEFFMKSGIEKKK